MNKEDVYIVPREEIENIPWLGSSKSYDEALMQLGAGQDKFLVINPGKEYLFEYIDLVIPDNSICVVWEYNNEWVAKLFDRRWIFDDGYYKFNVVPPITWTKNTDLDNLITFDNDPREEYKLVDGDKDYELVWYIDPKFNPLDDKVWALRANIKGSSGQGTKDMGYVSPSVKVEYNPEVPDFKLDIDTMYPAYYNVSHECCYMLDKKYDRYDNIWIVKFSPTFRKPKDLICIGTITPEIEDRLDVVFISYNESNAEENWTRVLEKAPWAKRVNGVTGIFNAHKAAAKLAKTDMFYVVDGDAWITDDWEFDFNPGIFDRDCAYVWYSENPVNGLVYENGGVKLFPRKQILDTKKWSTLDMFTGINSKLKSMRTVSCLTNFNADEFSTWRSAFRECVKLFEINKITALTAWTSKGRNKPFGKFAIDGAKAGIKFAKENAGDHTALLKINDYDWLRTEFERSYGK